MEPYKYRELRQGEIRLLELNCDKKVLTGTMRHYQAENLGESQSSVPPYMALSHHWGPRPASGDNVDVLVVHNEEEQELSEIPLRPGLSAALKAIRIKMKSPEWNSKGWNCHLWVDAICINQKSTSDKDKQLGKMGNIYNEAMAVIIWLGELDPETEKAIDFIKELQDLDVLCASLKEENAALYTDSWKCLGLFTRKPWFQRLWIVQEIAAARDAVILVGDQAVAWDDFAAAISLFVSNFDKVHTILAKDGFFGKERDPFGDLQLSGANIIVENRGALLRKMANGDVAEHLKPLEALLTTLSMFEVTEPHDIVYAILWLSNDASQGKKRAKMSHEYTVRTPVLRKTSGAAGSNALYDSPFSSTTEEHADEVIVRRSSTSSTRGIKRTADGLEVHLPAPQLGLNPQPVPRGRKYSTSGQFLGLPPRTAEQEQADRQLLSKDTGIVINYQQPVYELCVQVLNHIIQTTQLLDIICFHWAPPPRKADWASNPPRVKDEPAHPSWLLHARRNTYERVNPHLPKKTHVPMVVRRVKADPLVGRPGSKRRPYLACGRARATDVKIEDRVLHAYGYTLAKVDRDAGVATNAVIPWEWRELLDWTSNDEAPPDRFWRTLVADKGPHEQPPPARFKRACQWAFQFEPPEANLSLEKVRGDGDPEPPLKQFLDCAIATTWNRRLFITTSCQFDDPESTDSAYVGLGPSTARPGDVVCVLWGCAVPVLLRPTKREINGAATPPARPIVQRRTTAGLTVTVGDELDYTFVGECYVDGMMNGEIFNWAEYHKQEVQDFYIH